MATACRYFGLATAQGYANSQYELGVSYATGDGVTKDMVQALKWTSLAAQSGMPYAREAIGQMKREMSKTQIDSATRLASEFTPLKASSPSEGTLPDDVKTVNVIRLWTRYE